MAFFSHMIFYVEDIQKAVEFYSKAFDIQLKFIHESGQYAELDTGGTSIAFATEDIGNSNLPSGFIINDNSQPPAGCEIALTVEDVEKAYQKAIKSGAIKVMPPLGKPWGQTVAYVRDPNGLLIEICSKITNK